MTPMKPMKPKAAPMAEILHREDGRIEVVKDGRVLWCGRDLYIAQAISRSHNGGVEAIESDRKASDAAVHRAIPSLGDI